VLDRMPSSDVLLMVGGFTARVKVLDDSNDLWRGVLGRYGH